MCRQRVGGVCGLCAPQNILDVTAILISFFINAALFELGVFEKEFVTDAMSHSWLALRRKQTTNV